MICVGGGDLVSRFLVCCFCRGCEFCRDAVDFSFGFWLIVAVLGVVFFGFVPENCFGRGGCDKMLGVGVGVGVGVGIG